MNVVNIVHIVNIVDVVAGPADIDSGGLVSALAIFLILHRREASTCSVPSPPRLTAPAVVICAQQARTGASGNTGVPLCSDTASMAARPPSRAAKALWGAAYSFCDERAAASARTARVRRDIEIV